MTVEEREEYEHHLRAGTVVYAGVDYGAILEQAQAECDVLLWDGGNNDLPFYRPNLMIVVADPLRAGDETRFHPGEAGIRMADVVVINKVDAAAPELVEAVERRSTNSTPPPRSSWRRAWCGSWGTPPWRAASARDRGRSDAHARKHEVRRRGGRRRAGGGQGDRRTLVRS